MSIRNLVENKTNLDYQSLTTSLIGEFGITDPVNWDAVIPANVQHNLFGGETLRLFEDHPNFATQKDIRTIALKKGQTSQLLVLFAKLRDEKLSKSNIEKVTKKFIGGSAAERYVVWFLGNPSNTEFKVVLSGREGKKIVLKTLPFGINQPYYKTYDFILEEVHKKVAQLFVEPNELWKALWKSFDISVVNKKFYLDIKSAFDNLIDDKVFKGSIRIEEARKQFAVRLIGRIIFSWFLKKKNIISEVVLSSNAVSKYDNYYLEFLEKLFFEVFNTPQKERGKLPDEIKDYPFLNGGLFEAQDGDYGDYKGKVIIRNDWFSELFKNTLEKYNFTIDENTSASSEIAIDPEMLGRIFENLLAEQNPETQESARKSTGSYYTPREIVDYMVEQSISEYLKSNVTLSGVEHSVIEDFIHTEEFIEQLRPFAVQILEKLNVVKVLDPACGSGAFPIGILQKLIALKLLLASPLTKGGTQGGSKVVSVYDLKLQTILNSIYGCDIQPMAVELSRLRCWLSLIIDEDVDKKKSNWGIANLPNLDFKFVCVNTLIGLPPIVQDSLGTSADDFEKLKQLRNEFFTASDKRKLQIEKYFVALQQTIAEKQREWSTKNTTSVTMLIKWNPFKVEKTDWFDSFWMFGINDGFDITIGNPPYVSAPTMVKSNSKIREAITKSKRYSTLYQKWDLYIPFMELGLKLLSNNGVFSMIVPYPLTNQNYAMKLRGLIVNQYNLKEIVDLNGTKIFESATVSNCIPIISKSKPEKACYVSNINEQGKIQKSFIQSFDDLVQDKNTLVWNLTKEKREATRHPNINVLGDFCYISKGMVLNADEQTAQGEFSKDDLISDSYDEIHCRKYIEAKDIERYKVKKIRYLEYNTARCPDKLSRPTFKELYEKPKLMFNRLGKLMVILDAKVKFLNSDSMYSAVLWKDLEGVHNKSISASIKRYSNYSRKEMVDFSRSVDLRYLLAVLNSKYATILLSNLRGGDYHIYPEHIRNLPIPKISEKEQSPFVALVDKILGDKEKGVDTKVLEDQIDIMVYKLYSLTYEEVKIIDPEIEKIISKAEYERS